MHVMLISGSTRPMSKSLAIVNLLQERLEARGAASHVWALSEWPLPIMDPETQASYKRGTDPVLSRFAEDAEIADAFVLATPVYHDSYSGALKNALDFLPPRALAGKVFGLTSHGARQTTQPLAHLSAVVRALHSIQIPRQIATDDSDLSITEGKVVGFKDVSLHDRFDLFCGELLTYAAATRNIRRTGTTGET